MEKTIGDYKGGPVVLDYEPDEAPYPWTVFCLDDPSSTIRHRFPTEEEARAYAAGRYHLPVVQRNADPYKEWPDRADQQKIRVTMHWPEHRRCFCIDELPDRTWLAARGNQGFSFPTQYEALAFAAGRNWCGIKWYRHAREADRTRYRWYQNSREQDLIRW